MASIKRERRKEPASERLIRKVDKDSETGCWIWTGATKGNGYGHAWLNGRNHPAHRAVYMAIVGQIPDGRDLDHLCRNRICVNPAHLEPVTRSENLKRGDTGINLVAVAKAMTHCKRGHPFSEENTRIYNGKRCCRACARFHVRNRRISNGIRQ